MTGDRKVRVVKLIAVTEKVCREITNQYGEIKKQTISETSYFDFDGNFITSVSETKNHSDD